MLFKEHYQRWARAHFSEKLKKAGFVSYGNEDLSWYKVVNNEVLLTVYIYASFSIASIGMVGYGIHPLFINAPVPQKAYVSGWSDNEVMIQVFLRAPVNRLFDANTFVMCPDTPERGAECLDNIIFPLFSNIHNIEDCYAFHKQRWIEAEKRREVRGDSPDYPFATNDFIDMAIYMEDKEIYPKCVHDLESRRNWSNKKEQARMELQRQVFELGQREEYLKVLEKRRNQFVRRLNKKLGFSIE